MSGRKKLSERVKVGICRWWFAGAVYFFIGFGTSLGESGGLDLLFVIALVMGLGTALVFNPVIYRVFDIVEGSRVINKEYFALPLYRRVFLDLWEVVKAFVVVFLIWMTYIGINITLSVFTGKPEGTVFLPVEPFLFATFYLAFYTLLSFIGKKGRKILSRDKEEKA